MPINQYFGGKGEEVLKDMQKEYGEDKGKQVFYGVMNKRKKERAMGIKPSFPKKKKFYGEPA